MAFDYSTLRTDRTQADVDFANDLIRRLGRHEGFKNDEEERLWNEGLRGSYSYLDWNRVCYCMQDIQKEFNAMDISVNIISNFTEYTRDSDLTYSIANAYLATVKRFRRYTISMPAGTPDLQDIDFEMRHLTYEQANDIEKVLKTLHTLQIGIKSSWRHCGAATCGGGGLLIR